MKKILSALFVMFALSPAAHAAEILSLDCLASNGVILKGHAVRGQALTIDTQWGLVHQEFAAQVSPTSTADTTYVNLDSKDGVHYILALDAVSSRAIELQKASGTILQPSAVRGLQPTIVAYVRCDLRFR